MNAKLYMWLSNLLVHIFVEHIYVPMSSKRHHIDTKKGNEKYVSLPCKLKVLGACSALFTIQVYVSYVAWY
jgi:hypothetical protein